MVQLSFISIILMLVSVVHVNAEQVKLVIIIITFNPQARFPST